ncbi:MAG: C4-dicarboxylate TRAP transporter substrate-binding protein [Enhydrobacter sp.]|nr:C4-dicarboxylate TRAP transporter substrate-binding protein [Enhydrobacter sp.]
MDRRHFIGASAAAGLAAIPGLNRAQAQQVLKLTITCGHPPVFSWVKVLDETFIGVLDREIAAAGSPVKIEWTKAYGGTVAKLGAESDALRTSVSDAGIVSQIFEAAKFPLQQVTLQVPFGAPDIATVSRIVGDLHQRFPEMNDAWAKGNMLLLATVAIDGYQLVTNFPVNTAADLAGKKIFVPGPIANWLQGTGAVAVSGNLNTYYNGIQTGVAQGAIVSLSPTWSAKLHEVAPHITLCNLGAQYTGSVAFNLRTYQKLPPAVQQAVRKAGDAYGQEFARVQSALAEEALKNLRAAGATVTQLPDAERAKWAAMLPNLPDTWAGQLEKQGYKSVRAIVAAYVEALRGNGIVLVRDWKA